MSAPAPQKRRLFTGPDGKSLGLTFALVSSLFLLWGFCNGMIDVMDKHFQEELHLTLSQSAWVQFAHYLGYFLMAMPAGWLAQKLGYKGGIITGLLMVAVGGLWFVPATQIAAFWAFLLGVCLIAAGLTFLETVANPYTTVLGPREFAATRINLAQSCNGVGWLLGPIAGAMFFYSTDATGKSTGAETLWIPYAAVAGVVILLAFIFYKARLPDIVAEDDYSDKIDVNRIKSDDAAPRPIQNPTTPLALAMLFLNIVVLASAAGMIACAIASIFTDSAARILNTFLVVALAVAVGGSALLAASLRKLAPDSVWKRPHFTAAPVTQFVYMCAQASIFAYFINYMTSRPQIEVGLEISNQTASFLASVGFACFLAGRVTGAALLKKFTPGRVLGLYGLLNMAVCALVVLKLGWVSIIAVFASYFFMSIMFPTIFALGIHGLGARAKRASAYIVMAIMGGAIMPKLMGHVADHSDIAVGFLVPLACFAVVAAYGFAWKKLSRSGLRP